MKVGDLVRAPIGRYGNKVGIILNLGNTHMDIQQKASELPRQNLLGRVAWNDGEITLMNTGVLEVISESR